ncbi:MAG: hypothetical protein ACOYOS_05285 [Syntrophales bacterium]
MITPNDYKWHIAWIMARQAHHRRLPPFLSSPSFALSLSKGREACLFEKR